MGLTMLKSIKFLMMIQITALVLVMTPLLHRDCQAEYANPSMGNETDAAYWLDGGGLCAASGNDAAAVKAYKKALALVPDDSVAYFNLSLAFCEMGLYEDSLEAIKQAIQIEPRNGHYYYGQAWILVKAGKISAARAIFQRAAELKDPDARACLNAQD